MSETIPSLPGFEGLFWQVAPQHWDLTAGGALEIEAGAQTDMFVSPDGSGETLNAPRLCITASGNWLFSARVSVQFAATFDAGALLVSCGEREWGKLCFEYSPQAEPMVVSVVTRGQSDDCNSFVVQQDSIFLRIARMGPACAFHASLDGTTWQLVRHFTLDMSADVLVGLVAQSPTGQGCVATFRDVTLRYERLDDIRSGR